MRFSQRIGKRPLKSVFQVDDIDDDLRNRLWNIFYDTYLKMSASSKTLFGKSAWRDFFNYPLDSLKIKYDLVVDSWLLPDFKKWYLDKNWLDVYEFIEFTIEFGGYAFGNSYIEEINDALKLEVSAYRIVDKKIAQINSEQEIQAIEDAIDGTDNMKPVNAHLKLALDMLSDKTAPDYRNSIKESISAVEAYCNIITGDPKASLGKALAVIEKKHGLHGSLKTAFSALYGYTSDAGGIRHAMLEDDVEIRFEDAKFMMVSCSSFINYLSVKVS